MNQNTPSTAPPAATCEFRTCRRPATHRIISCGRYYEDVCSSHVAPVTWTERKWVAGTDVKFTIL